MVYILIREQCIYLFRSVNNGVGVTVKSEGPEVSKSECRPCVNSGRIRHVIYTVGKTRYIHTASGGAMLTRSLLAVRIFCNMLGTRLLDVVAGNPKMLSKAR